MSSAPLSRRSAIKLLGGGILAAIPASKLVTPAFAARTWCRKDPVIKVAGQTVDIWLASYDDLNEAATGPTAIDVLVPPGIDAQLLAVDRGFGGHGYAIEFVTDKSLDAGQVKVRVWQPAADRALPLVVNFAPRSSRLAPARADGVVNQWIKLISRS